MPYVLILFLGQESGVEVVDHPEPSHPLVNIWHCFRGLRAVIHDSKKTFDSSGLITGQRLLTV